MVQYDVPFYMMNQEVFPDDGYVDQYCVHRPLRGTVT